MRLTVGGGGRSVAAGRSGPWCAGDGHVSTGTSKALTKTTSWSCDLPLSVVPACLDRFERVR